MNVTRRSRLVRIVCATLFCVTSFDVALFCVVCRLWTRQCTGHRGLCRRRCVCGGGVFTMVSSTVEINKILVSGRLIGVPLWSSNADAHLR